MDYVASEALWPEGVPGKIGDGTEDNPIITPYLVQATTPTTAVVVCPGGGYRGRAAHEGEPIARWLNSLGVSAIVVNYRVAPYQHPYPLLDAQRAIRLVRYHAQEWGIDAQKVGILGFSAGGHLASTAGTHFDLGKPESQQMVDTFSCRPDFMILCYPVITFGEYRHHGSMTNLLGSEPSPVLRALLSNETQVTGETPPTFLWHTANDAGVPVENSLLFAAALSRNHVPFELHVFPSGKHGLGLATDHIQVNAWTTLCATWLRAMGYAPAL